ncbi:ATPase [Novosphingobium guangzhouense]|uniref:ATPase n=1 Tax=Novosphingobium guangzhouense TaxID=1850347 RepID=A0A2K2G5F7_9SPHN|nr:ATPase [Novosphingobium guangzhouense]PNU06218.1 ATPase [Novosphingobium guangzhouense]
MVGENRIIAFGAGTGEKPETQAPELAVETASEADAAEAWDQAWVAPAPLEIEDERPSRPEWGAVVFAGAVVLAWTAVFVFARLAILQSGIPFSEVPALIMQWSVPVLLVGVVWLVVMRHSARESRRFGRIARSLSAESAILEHRLTTVNRELSLAREFLASQSRDLETLGRIATERLSQNAERLQELVQDNGSRIDSISSVSTAALDNMEKLRGQLPVIASSAKDVTNNIANAGRSAHAQLEDMINGFNRLNEFGSASTRQVSMLRDQVNDTLDGFNARCEQLEQAVAGRFIALDERGEDFRTRLDKHEADALAAIRARAKALTDEIDEGRQQLDRQEAESLTSLRARLVALRDESDVVSRALRHAEERAIEHLRASLADLSEEQASAGTAIMEAQQGAIEALNDRLEAISSEARHVDESIGLRAERLAMEAQDRQSRQVEQERHAIARIDHMLGELDASIAERLERHRIQAAALAERSAAVTAELGRFEARLETIAGQTAEAEERIASSLAALTDRLTAARATLAVTDGEVEKLTDDSVRLLELIQASARQTGSALPEALEVSEDRLRRIQDALGGVLTQLREAVQGGEDVAAEIGVSGRDLDALLAGLSQAQSQIASRGADHAALLSRLQDTLGEIDAATQTAADKAGGALIGALAALGTTLDETVSAIEEDSAERITRIADTLGDESAAAIDKAMRGKVAEISGQLEQAVAHASGVTREATTQLREQIAKVDDLVGNLEGRVTQARAQAEEQVDNDFARRAAFITESLNSNAIDIATVLSGEIADSAWAAYLRGDRGIFTRRAVRLLDAGEVKAIQQIFERDDAFRANVSRYIHDFEGILRQVLSTRDGNALGVTLLSSDMGKLYVALAQGIERLRG